MIQTREEKLEVAAGEYAQAMKFKKNPDYLYINLVDAFIAGSKWSETEDYYYGEDEVSKLKQILDTLSGGYKDMISGKSWTEEGVRKIDSAIQEYNKIGGVK